MIVSWGDAGDLMLLLVAIGVVVAVYVLATLFTRMLGSVSYERASAVGVAANVLLGLLLFGVTFLFAGVYVTAPQIKEVVPSAQAAAAGLRPGDVIVSIDGQRIESITHAQRLISGTAHRTITLGIDRGTAVLEVPVTPVAREIADRFGNVITVGSLGLRYTENGRRYKVDDPVEAARLIAKDGYTNSKRALGYVQDVRFVHSPTEAPLVLLGEFVNLTTVLSLCFAALACGVLLVRSRLHRPG